MKSVKRRSIESKPGLDPASSVAPRLSENISLFQSLRVLQEGEEDSELAASTGGKSLLAFYIYTYYDIADEDTRKSELNVV